MSVEHNPYAPPQADGARTVARDGAGGSALVRWLAAIYCVGPVLFYLFVTLPLLYSLTHGSIPALSWALILVPQAVRVAAGLLLLIRREAVSACLLMVLFLLRIAGLASVLWRLHSSSVDVTWIPVVISLVDLLLLALIAAYALRVFWKSRGLAEDPAFSHLDHSQR